LHATSVLTFPKNGITIDITLNFLIYQLLLTRRALGIAKRIQRQGSNMVQTFYNGATGN